MGSNNKLSQTRTAPSRLRERLNQAIVSHQRGNLAHAQSLYEQILKIEPRSFDALHLLGVIAGQNKNPQRALALIDEAIQVDPDHAMAHCNKGSALRELGDPSAALASYDRAIAIDADCMDGHFNRGIVLRELGRCAAALASLERVIAVRPGFAEAHYQRAKACRDLERFDEALASCDRAIGIRANHGAALLLRGDVQKALGNFDAALGDYDRVLAVNPANALAHFNRGWLLEELKRWPASLAAYDQAIASAPRFAEAYCNRGIVLRELGQLDAAMASYGRALELKPGFAEACFNRGNLLRDLEQLPAALRSYDQALVLKPEYAECWSNRGNVLRELMQLDDAVDSYGRAIALRAGYAEAYFNRSTALLLLGDYPSGWRDYEWRRDGSRMPHGRRFHGPLWTGAESVAGKTVLLVSEQGLGDTLHFCRYAKRVADLGATVLLEAQPPLLRVLESLDGVARLLPAGGDPPSFDLYCPLLSLPSIFRTTVETIPATDPYLRADAAKVARWQASLGGSAQARVGLVWSGFAGHAYDHSRSIALADLIRCLPFSAHIQYYSLQKDVRESDAQTLQALQASRSIVDLSAELADFSDTAALCECMHLVISVDTSVAHLSAALGKTTCTLLAFHPDWRWLRSRSDTPWYPTMRLYRQEQAGQWDAPIRRLAAEMLPGEVDRRA